MRTTIILTLSILLFPSCTYYFGNSWIKSAYKRPPVSEFPTPASIQRRSPQIKAAEQPLTQYWAEKSLGDWYKEKGGSIRKIIAKLILKQEVEEMNQYIQQTTVWGTIGSSYFLNPKGDYDFTTSLMCALLYIHGEDSSVLYPQTVDHIVHELLVEEGGKARIKTPRTLRLMRDTENHILMTELSRYLKNQWLHQHGNTNPKYDNQQNGLEEWMIEHLQEMEKTGAYEFNAIPYLGYTVNALAILHAFADSKEIKKHAANVLDEMNWAYAFGSLQMRRIAPFRRRLERAGLSTLNQDPHTAIMTAWLKRYHRESLKPSDMGYGKHQAFMAMLLPYQPPNALLEWVEEKPKEYFVTFGHGKKASPEIYSGGKNYLLSAGGMQRGKASQIVARPTTLLLPDSVTDLKHCFYLSGKGEMKDWNNTGVYRHFACSNAPVHIPDGFDAIVAKEGWQAFHPPNSPLILTYSELGLGLLIIIPQNENSPEALIDFFIEQNPHLQKEITLPNQTHIRYDVNAAKGKWVIQEVNGKELNRDVDKWANFEWIE